MITQSDGTIRILDTGNVIQIETVRPEDGGNDTIQGDAADDVILGGAGGDEIDAGEGDNIVIGDSGKLVYSEGVLSTVETTAHDTGGNDTISTGSGNDLIFGGFGTDVITAAGGENLILGDNGIASFLTDGDGLSLDLLETTAPALGGDDVISSGNEDDIIFAGAGNDTINAGNGNNLVAGDNGRLTLADGIWQRVEATDPIRAEMIRSVRVPVRISSWAAAEMIRSTVVMRQMWFWVITVMSTG